MLRTGNNIAVFAVIQGLHGNEMRGLFNKAPIGPNFSDNWVYLGRTLLSRRHRMSRGCEGGGCVCVCVCVVYV